MFDQRRASPAMLPALFVSVAVHAAAGWMLFSGWRWAPVAWPQPITVTLDALPPAAGEVLPPKAVPRVEQPLASAVTAPLPRPKQVPILVAVAAIRPEPTPATPISAPVQTSAAAQTQAAQVTAGDAVGAGEAIEPPQFNVAYLNNPRPAYPLVARRLGLEGRVVLRVQVSARGAPEEVVVAQSSGAAVLDEAALKAVRGWTFVPARHGDMPIARAIEVPIRFRLQN